MLSGQCLYIYFYLRFVDVRPCRTSLHHCTVWYVNRFNGMYRKQFMLHNHLFGITASNISLNRNCVAARNICNNSEALIVKIKMELIQIKVTSIIIGIISCGNSFPKLIIFTINLLRELDFRLMRRIY